MRLSWFSILLLCLLAACGAEEPPLLGDAGPRPAEMPGRKVRIVEPGAVLAATGRQSFQGPTAFRCVLHDEQGLQLNFRPDEAGVPVVAVRIEEYRGSGSYRARLFMTGRSKTGALVSSAGEGNVEVEQGISMSDGAVVLVAGSFRGTYGGQAGKGSVEGRFGPCRFAADRGGSSPAAGTTAGP